MMISKECLNKTYLYIITNKGNEMKRRFLVIGGSIAVVLVLTLVSFVSIVSAQSFDSSDERTISVQHMVNKLKRNTWEPGMIIDLIREIIGEIQWYLFFMCLIVYVSLFGPIGKPIQ